MRLFILAVLVVLLGVIQGQMWFGPGGVPKVAELQQQLRDQKAANQKVELENARLASEVTDLKTGLGTVEEKARMELGMVRPNEIFVQFTHGSPVQAAPGASAQGVANSKPPAVKKPAGKPGAPKAADAKKTAKPAATARTGAQQKTHPGKQRPPAQH